MLNYSPTSSSSRARRNNPSFSVYVKRLFQFPQMDFEIASWQMIYLIIAPTKVFRSIYYQKQTKNQWSRDDPAFVLLLSICLTSKHNLILIKVSAIAYALAFGVFTFSGIFTTIFYMIIIEFLLTGFVIASMCW